MFLSLCSPPGKHGLFSHKEAGLKKNLKINKNVYTTIFNECIKLRDVRVSFSYKYNKSHSSCTIFYQEG